MAEDINQVRKDVLMFSQNFLALNIEDGGEDVASSKLKGTMILLSLFLSNSRPFCSRAVVNKVQEYEPGVLLR